MDITKRLTIWTVRNDRLCSLLHVQLQSPKQDLQSFSCCVLRYKHRHCIPADDQQQVLCCLCVGTGVYGRGLRGITERIIYCIDASQRASSVPDVLPRVFKTDTVVRIEKSGAESVAARHSGQGLLPIGQRLMSAKSNACLARPDIVTKP